MNTPIKASIVGGTGYTGSELVRLLLAHPKVQLHALTSRSECGKRVDALFPALRGATDLQFVEPDIQILAQSDVVFFASPHGVCMQMAADLLALGVVVIDLGADFRLQDTAVFHQYYHMEHTCPDVLAQAVYGMPEIHRDKLKNAKLIANPGCYPTTAILGLKPIIDTQNHMDIPMVAPKIIIDAKSGVSGAGRQAKLSLLFGNIHENFSAYGVQAHRHSPEIHQGIHTFLQSRFRHNIRFVPHLVPMFRGMLSTIHLTLTEVGRTLDWQDIFAQSYQNEQFVDVLPSGVFPETQSVRGCNTLRIGVCQNDDDLTIIVVQDNLVKGAAGQAIQNMNAVFGFAESLGLLAVPIVP